MHLDQAELAAAQSVENTLQEHSDQHLAAREHWLHCTNSHAASAAYYEKTEVILREQVMPMIGSIGRALDVGCGDGRYSLVMGEWARSVRGIDLSAALIAQAQDRAAAAGVTRVQFECRDAESTLPTGSFDLVSCMGMLSTLVDEGPYRALIAQLVDRVRPGGWLLTKETVCEAGDRIQKSNGYPMHYRHVDRYRQDLRQAGLEQVTEIQLARWNAAQINCLWLWRRPEAPVFQGQNGHTVPDLASQAGDAATAATVRAGSAEAQGVTASDDAIWHRLADQQDRQSEVLLSIGTFLCDLGERLQQIEARVGEAPAVDFKPLIARLDRLESTLHWSARQPRDVARSPIRVAFLIHHAPAWPALRGIVDAMQADPGFEPLLISVPHRFPMLGQLGGEADVHQMLVDQGYAHMRVPDAEAEHALDRLKLLNPQVVFRQAPWDNDVPGCLSAHNLSFAKLCYVPYGYLTAKIEKQQFDQNYHRQCWRIFCPDEAHLNLYTQHSLLAGRNCRVTGFPKFDHLLRHKSGAGHWPVAQAQKKAFRLVWAPHFSYVGQWLRFGVFDRMAEQMLDFTAQQPQLEVVLRPHPAMREALIAAPADSFLGQFYARWKALPNTALSMEQEYADLFAASHALLTDGLSFLSEYQFFDKPLVFFEREGHVGFNEAGGKLLEGMYRVQTFDGVRNLLSMLRQGSEDKAVVAARRRIAAQVHPFPGEAAGRILEVIRREIGSP